MSSITERQSCAAFYELFVERYAANRPAEANTRKHPSGLRPWTTAERNKMMAMRDQGSSLRQICRVLRRSDIVVKREINRIIRERRES